MSENTTITAGSGVTVGADEVTIGGASQKLQRVKVYDATNDSTNALTVYANGAIKAQVTSGTIVASVTGGTVGGTIAHDSPATSGNPVRIGVRARGTLSAYTSVATNDVTEVHADLDGVLLTRLVPLAVNLTTRVAPTTAASAGFTQLAATTLLRNYITSINVYNNGATAVGINILNGTTGSAVFWSTGAAAKVPQFHAFNPPLRQGSTNTALGYKISAAIGGSGVFISVTGFQSKL
jgi:hypothetical protein